MSDQQNGPSWARRTQARENNASTNPLRIILIILACIAAPVIGLNVLHRLGGGSGNPGQAPAGMTYGGFGAPSREQAATLLQTFDAASEGDGKNFDREVKEMAGGFLKPEALFRPGGIAAAEAILKREHDLVAKYQALAAQRNGEERSQLGALYSDPDQKQRALTAFDNQIAQIAPTMDNYWRLQFEMVSREQTLVSFLARARGAWRPYAGKVMFMNTAMMQAYQRDLNDMRGTEAQISDLVAQMHVRSEQARAERRATLGE
jgi:hypothetical protein